MANDFYATLGVSKTADAAEIKRSYRKLAGKLHPDKHPDEPNVEARFKEVNQAYQVLSDPKKRALYDEFGEEALREGFDPDQARASRRYRGSGAGPSGNAGSGGGDWQGSVPSDFFSSLGGSVDLQDLFGDLLPGQRRGAAPRRTGKGSDLESSITIDFASAVRGTTLRLQPRGGPSEPVTVRIPPGAEEGSRLRVPGQGAPGSHGGAAGDLVLTIHVTPHAHFRREGDDLHLDLPVTPGEAYGGAKVNVPTAGGAVLMKLPARSQSGHVVRVKGKGVARRNKPPGDLYVHLQVQLPVNDEAAEAIAALEQHLTADVRQDVRL